MVPSSDKRFIYSFIGFYALSILLGMPLLKSGLLENLIIRCVFLVATGYTIYRLLWSKRGPGVEGIERIIGNLWSPIGRLDEHKKVRVAAPLYVVSVVLAVVYIGLALGEKAGQMRALFATYEPDRTVMWVHSGDAIDVYVGSSLVTQASETNANKEYFPLAHWQYKTTETSDGVAFRSKLNRDLAYAEAGQLSLVSEPIDVKSYRNPDVFSVVQYHGIFGFTGVGVLEVFMAISIVIVSGAILLMHEVNSKALAGWALMIALYSGVGLFSISGILQERPIPGPSNNVAVPAVDRHFSDS